MLNLKDITILSINTRDPELSIKAIQRSCKYINFGKKILITDKDIKSGDIEIKKIPTINSLEEYSYFCVKKLNDFVDTKHCLIVQPDGFVTNPLMWSDEFLKYDYVAAPWDKMLSQRAMWLAGMGIHDPDSIPAIVGNGGFSLRSKKLLEICSNLDYKNPTLPEDVFIMVHSRQILKDNAIKIAPLMLAKRFSLECPIDMNEKNVTLDAHFGFHGSHEFKKPLLDLLNNIKDDVSCIEMAKRIL